MLLNFHRVLPEASRADIRHVARASLVNHCRYLVDFARLPLAGQDEVRAICRDEGSFEASATTVYRDRFYQAIYQLLEERAAAGDAIAGSNFWAWGGEGRTQNADFMWKAGDGFVGDPPQEPQGLYCVFDSDASTIAIIQAHAVRMAALKPAK